MARHRSIGTNTDKVETKEASTQAPDKSHELNATYSKKETKQDNKKHMNKTYQVKEHSDAQMDHSDLDQTSQAVTSKEAESPKKHATHDESHVSQKRAAHHVSDHHNDAEEIRFHLSDLSNDQSPLNLTNVADQMNHLTVNTPKSTRKKQPLARREAKKAAHHEGDTSLESSKHSGREMPVLRRSERLRLKRLNTDETEPVYRVNLKHVTMRRNNSRYEEQQRQIRKSRRNA